MRRKILNILSLSLTLLFLVIAPSSGFSEDTVAEDNENSDAYIWDKAKCPIDITDYEAPSYLQKDFSVLNLDDYEDYMETFHQNLRNKLVSELTKYYSDKYDIDMKESEMENVIDNQGIFLPKGDETDINTTIQIKSEIKSCLFEDVKIAETVERVKIEMEYQAFITNSLIDMITLLQNRHNNHRTNPLKKAADVNSNSTNTFTTDPMR